MKKIIIIGSGNIGSRHLQALKAVKKPLQIFVVDQSKESLELARSRYDSMPESKFNHKVNYFSEIPTKIGTADLAIIATCSDIRAKVTKELFRKCKVRYLVLEKLLFGKKSDYGSIGKLIKKSETKTWVNCSMRMMPAYNELQPEFYGQRIFYNSIWGGYGLVTSAIHHLDLMVFLTGSDDFIVDTAGLDKKIVPSKRKNFLEFTGTLRILFKNGSTGEFISQKKGNIPPIVQFHCNQIRYLVRETESKAWVSRAQNDWCWQEIEALVPFQSQLTTKLAEDILTKGSCQLTRYDQSVKIHLRLLGSLLKFLNRNSVKKYNYFPFT